MAHDPPQRLGADRRGCRRRRGLRQRDSVSGGDTEPSIVTLQRSSGGGALGPRGAEGGWGQEVCGFEPLYLDLWLCQRPAQPEGEQHF